MTSAQDRMEGNLGILYVCGEQTGGDITAAKTLLGRKVRGICGAYDRFVALVDAWELDWPVNGSSGDEAGLLESQLVAEGLQDIKVQHVAVGRNHRVALSLDGQLFSWGRQGSALASSELGHRHGMTKAQNYFRVKTPGPEDDLEKSQLAPTKSTQALNNLQPYSPTATGIPHRVVTAPDLFFTQVACGKHHSAAVTDAGDVYTWGQNYEGQLGQVLKTLPKEVNTIFNGICAWPKYVGYFLGLPRVESTCCGNTFTAVLLADGSVYLLGGSSLRPAPIASKNSSSSANTPNLILRKGSDGKAFVGIACGYEHILAVTSSGEMYSWGLNTYGQLGHGGKTGRGHAEINRGKAIPSAVNCNDAIKWAKVFAGGNYSAALSTESQLYTWGNGSYGKLGHGKQSGTSQKYGCEFVPRRVDYLQNTVVGSVVCTERNLFAFASTYISVISPVCGEHVGGYELRIRGSGFWASDNVTVRFVPLTDGRLLRGTLGTFCKITSEIVCQVPKFRLPGEYAVEVSMNGKHFTSNGRIFTVFKRPHVASVSIYDSRFSSEEEVTLSLSGSLPEICRRPIVRFVRCHQEGSSGLCVPMSDEFAVPAVVGIFDDHPEIVDEGDEIERDPSDVTGRLLRLKIPSLPISGKGIVPYTLEISYDGGLMFAPVSVDPTLSKQKDGEADADEDGLDHYNHHQKQELPQPATPHIIFVHDAQLLRVTPNSFIINELPQVIRVELQHILPSAVAQFSIKMVYTAAGGPQKAGSASATITIDSLEGNSLTCSIPPLPEWQCIPPANSKAQGLPTEWWKALAKTGFVAHLGISMNSGRTFLPAQLQLGGRSPSIASQVFGMSAPGRLLSLFPDVGMTPGGTQVSIAGDFFHFDTQDAAVKLRWRESSIVVPAMCLRPEEFRDASETSSANRRVVFRTPPLPFPEDATTAAAMAEGMVLGTREEVEVLVSLDGEHFTDTSLSFVYCAVPEVTGVTPLEAEPGTKMVLAVDKVISSSAACVKLETAQSNLSLVLPVAIDETSATAEFVLPEMPLLTEDLVQVALSLNGQEFTDVSEVNFRLTATVANAEPHVEFLKQVRYLRRRSNVDSEEKVAPIASFAAAILYKPSVPSKLSPQLRTKLNAQSTQTILNSVKDKKGLPKWAKTLLVLIGLVLYLAPHSGPSWQLTGQHETEF
ncbi:unnamed protein product [Phytophthora lilii]|uniref:Unnamed protein product n=1 Tax=Phytophthora lilii TaxID=2077276 RepID=A0A9W6TEL7_9STRA|nr:unnamed protein product [Phytophthora lilii]